MTSFHYDEVTKRWKCTYAPAFPMSMPNKHAIMKTLDLDALKEIERIAQAKLAGNDVRKN